MQSMRAYQEKAERLEQVIGQVRGRMAAKDAGDIQTFVARFYERLAPEDVLEFPVDSLYGAALAIWKFAEQRKSGEARVRVYNPRVEAHGWKSAHTIVEIVNDDMPFLVDSITGYLTRRGHVVHLTIHPIIRVIRDANGRRTGIAETDGKKNGNGRNAGAVAESVMHVEIDEQSDPKVLDEIATGLKGVLQDVRSAVEDWQPILARLDDTIAELTKTPPPLEKEEVEETKAFLTWMRDNHFTFLGSRDYSLSKRNGKDDLKIVEGSGLGLLRLSERSVMVGPAGRGGLAPILQQFLERPELMLISKTSARGTVHRPVHMDYVAIKRYDAKGKLTGERRFIGLFTSSAYSRTPRDIPLLRRKVRQTLERARVEPSSHDGKALVHILESYPRDELFQIDVDTLFQISTGILGLAERPRIRLFARQDKFDRFFSCIVFIPRERWNTTLRRRFDKILVDAFNGRLSNFYTQISDAPLARLHYVIGTDPGKTPKSVDYAQIESRLIAAARSWHDDLYDALIERWGEEGGNRLAHKYGEAFPTSYNEAFNADLAMNDIEKMEALDGPDDVALNFYCSIEDPAYAVRFKIYHPGAAVPLSDCLPMLEHMGLRVISEEPFLAHPEGADDIWIHDFHMEDPTGAELDLAELKAKFEDAFDKVWRGEVEDDGFNRLVMRAGLSWRDVVIIRAYAKYLRQAGMTFSQDYVEDTLAGNPKITRLLVALFHTRFDPHFEGQRGERAETLAGEIELALDEVVSLDEDRILRRFLNLVLSTLRTNFYRPGDDGQPRSYVSVKFDSQAVAELPLPRPFREIFVYSPRVEGVHLRGGKVARGGLRWSDRREDFRTEVLGLMKAQMVKNAVIVPVGSKGGFVPKRLPASGDREAFMAEGVACYKTFISGLLDVTDNLAGGEVVPPPDVMRYDDDDPYLVVAADKGTATFSDIANGVAIDYGFWLGDAFASGGAAGYDHKKMGITAKGAWESVKRHFRELGRDIQKADFTVVGVGDMSGDVFGNGMLLSKQTRLLAAFDHRHIFIDPDPHPAKSWKERKRMFGLPRSSWLDYDEKLISAGGGVFDRKAKSITLTPEIKRLTGLSQERATPNDLMRALLKADADLLWFGGIGTYVKAADENNNDVGDRANDPLRVNGAELRCKVIGEGGNLGCTQRGRIEFAQAGGRVNTDAVDNSAGVDCSDHEVNIKILIDAIVADGEMTGKQRNRLLAEMTDEVGDLVLRDNYLQTQALSMLESQGPALLEPHARFMRELERAGQLDRAIEFLPNDDTVQELSAVGQGLTRPELSVLLAYAKMVLDKELANSDLTESEYLTNDLVKYFPRPLRKQYKSAIMSHRLRSEIIATVMANSIVNRTGVTFVHDVKQETGCDAGAIARAYAVARDAFDMRRLWNGIEALDNKVPADQQIEMMLQSVNLLRRTTMWLLRNMEQPLRIATVLNTYKPGIAKIMDGLDAMLGKREAKSLAVRIKRYADQGVPKDLARRVASLDPLIAACDIVQVAGATGRPVEDVGWVYFVLGERLRLDWLRSEAEMLHAESHWDRTAIAAIVEDLFGQQRALTRIVLDTANGAGGEQAVTGWCAQNETAVARSATMLDDFEASGLDISKLALANRNIRMMIVH